MDKWQKVVEFLTGGGESLPTHGLVRGNKEVFVLSSPLSFYLNQVNKFLFSGGIKTDVQNAENNDPRQALLDSVIESNQLDSKLETLWRRGSITGEILVTITVNPDKEGYYVYNFFEKPEFSYTYGSNGRLSEVDILTKRVDSEGTEWLYKQRLDTEFYYDYPLIEASKAGKVDWDKLATLTPHGYRCVPATVIKNTPSLTNSRGKSDFTKPVVDMAMQVVLQTQSMGENFYFFGNPLFNTPDPDEFMSRVKRRMQAIEKLPEVDGGSTNVINITPVPKEVFDYLKNLKSDIYQALGVNWNDNAHSTDLSSLTLRILNQDTISTAEKKWLSYVDNGLKTLFEKTLLMCAVDGLTSLVNPLDGSTYTVEVTRKQPYFSETPAEKLTQFSIAGEMTNLGIRRAKALQLTIFPSYSEEEILEMMEGDF